MTFKLAIVALLICTACHSSETEPPQRKNIEVVGASECLSSITIALELPIATSPVWVDRIGTVEFGPFGAKNFFRVMEQLRREECVRAIRQRPCKNEGSDVNTCSTPERLS